MVRHDFRRFRAAVIRRLLCALAGLCLLIFSGCAVGPNFKTPSAKVPPAWPAEALAAHARVPSPSEEALARWWEVFDDPTLSSLVGRAVEGNLDLVQAQLRIRQARASRGIAGSSLWPSVDASGSVTRTRTPAGTGNLFREGLDSIWELDLFGGNRRAVEAAIADVSAAEEDRRDVLVSLSAEVALDYIDLRGFQQQIALAQKELAAQRHTAELTRKRKAGGFVGALDVSNADALVAQTASQIPALEASARQTIYSLSVLLGDEPSALVEELSATGEIPVAPPAVPLGVPSDLLRRRPDIRRAEAAAHAATARVGVAMADLFPRITLSGSLGLSGSQLSDLSSWGNRTVSAGPSVSVPIFNAGRIRSNVEVQRALADQSVVAYQQTVLAALQEVENALIASTKEEERRKALVDAVAANRKAVDLATQLYTQGQTDFLNVLNAQRSLLSTEDALTQSNRNISQNLVALYKALGGGWSEQSGPS